MIQQVRANAPDPEALDELRGSQLEIASNATEWGFKPHDVLWLMESQSYSKSVLDENSSIAVSFFIAKIFQQWNVKTLLEYSVQQSWYSTLISKLCTFDKYEESIVDPDFESISVSYLSPSPDIIRPLSVIFGDKPLTIFQKADDLVAEKKYTSIICQPALNVRTEDGRDRFGVDIVSRLSSHLEQEGHIFWITGRHVLTTGTGQAALSRLSEEGLRPQAVIDIPPGLFHGSMIESALLILGRENRSRRFVGALRDIDNAEPMALAFLSGPSNKSGPSWTWINEKDTRTFSDIEQEKVLRKLVPKGRHQSTTFLDVLVSDAIEKADKPIPEEHQSASFLYIPEYANGRVTVDLDEQTAKPKAVYRLAIDSKKANPRFLAQLLNSPFGKLLRETASTGMTIQRLSRSNLLDLELPVPDLSAQEKIVKISSDFGLMKSTFQELQSTLDSDWTTLPEIADTVDELKGVLDLDRKIDDWWRELPYPLATIYRRYHVSSDPKERLETILHFFEMASVYLAAMGTSYVRALRPDWQKELAKWLHPQGAAGIERTDFAFWIRLAGASLKDTSRISSTPELRNVASELAGPELVQVASNLGPLGKATDVLNVALRYRNSWKGHGGHIKASDAQRLVDELQQPVRDLYEITASMFRNLLLVRPGKAEFTDAGALFEIESLRGSDPTFERNEVELDRPVKSNALSFWFIGSRTMCRALPFFRLGAPQQPQETSFYVFNRVENGGFRWISYQEAREQEFVAPDEELQGLIEIGNERS